MLCSDERSEGEHNSISFRMRNDIKVAFLFAQCFSNSVLDL